MPSRVLILDADQRSALAVVRSLGQRGLRVLAADAAPTALAGCSRYCQQYLQSPCPRAAPMAFVDWLVDCLPRLGIEAVFPVTDLSSQLLLLHRDRLPPVILPFAPLETVMALADKGRLLTLAEKAGVPHPATTAWPRGDGVPESALSAFPLVIKPCRSRLWLGDRWLPTSVHVARDLAEARGLLEGKDYLREHPVLIQEFIPGHGEGVFALYDHERPVTFFAHRRIREKPPTGGVSVLSESAAVDPQLEAYTRRLLDAVGWHGVAMVEFRVTPEGRPYLMEVNTRFWGSLQLAIDSGVDFPWLLWQVAMGQAPDPVPGYRVGQRLRWLLGDLDSLYLVLKDRGHFGGGEKIRRVLEFLTPHWNTRHEVNRWGDLGPGWYELRKYARALLGRG